MEGFEPILMTGLAGSVTGVTGVRIRRWPSSLDSC